MGEPAFISSIECTVNAPEQSWRFFSVGAIIDAAAAVEGAHAR